MYVRCALNGLGKNCGLGIEEAKRKGIKGKLVLGASVYHIWLQRNCRIFGRQVQSKEHAKKDCCVLNFNV